MKFKVNQKVLVTALNHLIRNIDTKFDKFADLYMLPVDNATINLVATNGVVTMTYKLDVEMQELATTPIAIKAQKFFDVVSRLDGTIAFNNGEIKSKKSKIKIAIKENPETFFETPEVEALQLNAVELQEALKNRLYACDDINTHLLSGVCLNGDDVVACNGNLLSLCTMDNKLPFEPVIIDKKLASEIVKCFGDEKIYMGFSTNKIVIESEKIKIVSMLKIGEYPKYKQLIPNPAHSFDIDRNELIKALELISLVVNNNNLCVLNIGDNSLKVEAIQNTDGGDTTIDIDYNDEPIQIGFNVILLLDALKNISSESISFGFSNALSACLLVAENEKTLIMPMQFSR